MSVTVKKISASSAEITWEAGDDPHGWLARTVESDELAYSLEALGDGIYENDSTRSEEAAGQAAFHTRKLAQLLERRANAQIVRLRDVYGWSWRGIAEAVYGDADRQSTVRRQYDAARRDMAVPVLDGRD